MQTYEKLSDYKRSLKTFIRGTIKAKIYVDDKAKLILNVTKTDEDTKCVTVATDNGVYTATFEALVSTRIYNKVDEEFFAPIIAQFGKLKGFGGIEVNF